MGANQSCHTANTFINVNPADRNSIDDSFQTDPRLNKTWSGSSARDLMGPEEENNVDEQEGALEDCNREMVAEEHKKHTAGHVPRSINLSDCLEQAANAVDPGPRMPLPAPQNASFAFANHMVTPQGPILLQQTPTLMHPHVGMPAVVGWQVMPTPTVYEQPLEPFSSPKRVRIVSALSEQSAEVAFSGGSEDRSTWTTRMVKNLPNDYRRQDVLDMLDFLDVKYDFIYLPMDWGRRANLGYAFVNLISPQEAVRIESVITGFSEWRTSSEKKCEVVWGKEDQQSLRANVERFRNSPVMHPDVPEEFKPLIFTLGRRSAFPAPTKRIRPPREFQRKGVSQAEA